MNTKTMTPPLTTTKSNHKNNPDKPIKTTTITIIAAVSQNNALGKNNRLIWHLPADLKRFKKITYGHHVIMGRKTYESVGKPLPGRTNIIITRQKEYSAKNCIVVNSLEEALNIALEKDPNPYILGGAQIYKQAIQIADRIDLTRIHHAFEADAFFPEIDPELWKEKTRENFKATATDKYDYSFSVYERI